ncbi:TetR family transcriptional regulator [Sciscionella sediminilitoris]|uniref:acyl-CoA-like ligand-binding transcription factor n=1 Tax=Sciscionella sediminilitoris TaxID=1445613 RepID=UPI0004DF7B5A|nr:TetR family transcriptional regulator [Sciscionella sp. SE31]
MGLRERKKAATRAALSWAAIRLAVEHGLDAVRVEQIAEAADVSPRTFNNYFSSKAEAIASRHLDRCLGIAEALRARPAAEPLWEAIAASALAQLEPGAEVAEHPIPDAERWSAGLRMMVREPALHAEVLRAGATAESAITAAVAARTGTDPDRELYPHLVAAAVIAAMHTAITHHVRTDPPVPVPDLLTEALSRIAAGLPRP